MDTTLSGAHEVIAFWHEAGPTRWFAKDDAFDAHFRDRFLALHEQAAAGWLDDWCASAEGTLALLILLDQFPRNAFRNTARMYATDAMAARIARAAIGRGWHRQVPAPLRHFMVLPLMHAESLADQELSVVATAEIGGEPHRYAVHHRDIIRRFGRFPHRNALLGRASTPAEERFMAEGGFAG